MEMSNNNLGVVPLVRLDVAAARLGVSVRTLFRDIADKKLRVVHIRGCARIKEVDLQDYIERSKEWKKRGKRVGELH